MRNLVLLVNAIPDKAGIGEELGILGVAWLSMRLEGRRGKICVHQSAKLTHLARKDLYGARLSRLASWSSIIQSDRPIDPLAVVTRAGRVTTLAFELSLFDLLQK